MRKIIWICAWFSMVVLFTAGAATGATYYVRTDGSDLSSGLGNSAAHAWATIQNAANHVAAGDVVLIQEGIYPETVLMTATGTADMPIVYQGIGDVFVSSIVFERAPELHGVIHYYTTLEHLNFKGDLIPEAPVPNGLKLQGSYYVSVLNCTFDNYVKGLMHGDAGYTGNAYITVRHCVFSNNTHGATGGSSGMLVNSSFDNCLFTNNDIGYQPDDWGTRSTTFTNCIFSNNRIGMLLDGVYWYYLKTHSNTINRCIFSGNDIGLLIGDEAASTHSGVAYDNHVYNSVFYGNTNAGILINTNFSGVNDSTPAYFDAKGQTFINNIFMNNGTYGLDNLVNQTIFARFNLAFNNGLAPGNNAEISPSNASLVEDPRMTDPDNGNFRLMSDSPCIDAGDPAFDSDPAVGGAHIDIGAYEYTGLEDGDGDGYDHASDCDDMDPGIHPGAPEICGNEIDENCDGLAALCTAHDVSVVAIRVPPKMRNCSMASKKVRAEVENHGEFTERVSVQLTENGIQTGETTVYLDPGSVARVSLALLPASAGTAVAEICVQASIQDNDSNPTDNRICRSALLVGCQ